jgi:hypothetical protein
MLPYLIAGAIGFVVGKLLEEDEALKYADGGLVDMLKSLFIKNGFTQDDLQRILEENKNYFNQIEFYDNETIIVYRTIALPRRLVDKFIQLDKQEIGEGIGEYWTLDKEFGRAVWGGGHYEGEETFDITCVGHLNIKDIDWEMMKYAFNDDGWHFGSESEIRGVNGGNAIKVIECNEIYSNGGLIAPNGKPSNLTPEQYKLVREPAFKKWFGDWENDPATASKVVDSNGEPLVVYHATKEKWWDNYFVFNPQYEGKSTNVVRRKFGSTYFTSKKKVAETFGNIVIPVFLNFKNPIVFDANYTDIIDLDDELEKTKYEDDIIIQNTYDYRDSNVELDSDMSSDIFITTKIFNAIKLADGSNTTFDGNNPDIRFNEGGQLKKISAGFYRGVYKGVEYEIINIPEQKVWYWLVGDEGGDDWYNYKKTAIAEVKSFIDDNNPDIRFMAGGELTNNDVLKNFVNQVEAYQSNHYGTFNRDNLVESYHKLPDSIKEKIKPITTKNLFRGSDGTSYKSAISFAKNQDYAKMFGAYAFPFKVVKENKGLIDTKRLSALLNKMRIANEIGDDEGEVIVIEPIFSKDIIENIEKFRFDDGGLIQPKDLTKINNFKNIHIGVDYYAYSDDIEKQNKSDRWYELFVKNQKYEKITPEEFKEFISLSNELAWEDLD